MGGGVQASHGAALADTLKATRQQSQARRYKLACAMSVRIQGRQGRACGTVWGNGGGMGRGQVLEVRGVS